MSERLANALRTARGALGWTQKRLFDESGVSIDTIVRLEGNDPGRPQAETLTKLAIALDLSPDSLVSAANSSHQGSVDSSQPAVDSVRTDQSGDTGAESRAVSDMQSDPAARIEPTSGQEAPARESDQDAIQEDVA